ncbi:MAG: zinc-binding dehydrogenase, partial [Pseudomonadota bacterium]|nr:zinc-binding dehydrogenase [Pseudomonadota bacterium]
VPTAMLMGKQARVIGVTVGSRRHQLDMIAAIDATGIRPVVETRFALADLADAFRHQESGLHFGKIGIEI